MSHEQATAGARKPHVLPLRVYLGVSVSLLILTVVTVKVSYMDFGLFNIIVAMGVATIKGSLVVLFFMHLKYDEKFNAIVFVGSLAFLAVFLVLTLADTMERGRVDPLEQHQITPVPGRPELMEGGAADDAHGAADDAHGEEGAATDDASHEAEAPPEGEAATPEDDSGGH